MPEVPEWFPSTIEEMYRPEPGRRPSINDPRVVASHGGGMYPVQHWGVLTDGRVFYFRYRHGVATVKLAPSWYEPGKLPARDLRVSMEDWDTAWHAALEAADGVPADVPNDALPRLWLGPIGGYEVTEKDYGWFDTQEELDDAFRHCLDEVWDEPFDEQGWALLREQGS